MIYDLKMSPFALTLIGVSLLNLAGVHAQDEPPNESADGYVIISSRDTLQGVHSCHVSCQVDAQCPERQRCVAVPEVGQMCMQLRPESDPPPDWRACEITECTPNELCARRPGPTLIQAFIEHKERRGFEVHLIDETDWGGAAGDAAADNIRAWLQAHYISLNIRYALLIGDPRPTGDVPMRSTRPAHNAYQSWADDPVVPTDFYYAELTGDWDIDGDGKLAEYFVLPNQIQMGSPASRHPEDLGDDMSDGGAERDAEIAVGRIPFYGNVDDLDHILQKTMDYENTPEEETLWRQSVLLAAEGQRRAFFGELIRDEITQPQGYNTYRVYDVEDCWDHSIDQDDGCLSPIDGTPESLICSPTLVEAGINAQQPGLVAWLTHGSGQGAQSVMLQSNARSLSDDRPFFTFQASCLNSQPALSNNLAYELLKNGAIGTIGAATISHGPGSPMPSLRNDAGNAGMAYNFAERLIVERMSAGEALNDLRRDVGLQSRWWYWKNYLTFSLWGDPSVGLYSYALEGAPVITDASVMDMDALDLEVIDMELVDLEIIDMMSADQGLTEMGQTDIGQADMEADVNVNPDDTSLMQMDQDSPEVDSELLPDHSSNSTDQREANADAVSRVEDRDQASAAASRQSSGCQSAPRRHSTRCEFTLLVLSLMMMSRSKRRCSA